MEEKDGKYIFGVVKVGEKGQIVIPRDARKKYDVNPGDSVMVVGDENGMAILKTDLFYSIKNKYIGDLNK